MNIEKRIDKYLREAKNMNSIASKNTIGKVSIGKIYSIILKYSSNIIELVQEEYGGSEDWFFEDLENFFFEKFPSIERRIENGEELSDIQTAVSINSVLNYVKTGIVDMLNSYVEDNDISREEAKNRIDKLNKILLEIKNKLINVN